jgi:hypothetical protein
VDTAGADRANVHVRDRWEVGMATLRSPVPRSLAGGQSLRVPVVTFWQVTADLALGFGTPPGHGHNFSGEHVDGWNAILRPSGWTPEMLDELRAKLRRE